MNQNVVSICPHRSLPARQGHPAPALLSGVRMDTEARGPISCCWERLVRGLRSPGRHNIHLLLTKGYFEEKQTLQSSCELLRRKIQKIWEPSLNLQAKCQLDHRQTDRQTSEHLELLLQLKISFLPCYYLGDLVPELLPHAAVYQEVDRAGETHEGVDGQHNVVCQLIIHPIRLLLKHNLILQKQFSLCVCVSVCVLSHFNEISSNFSSLNKYRLTDRLFVKWVVSTVGRSTREGALSLVY